MLDESSFVLKQGGWNTIDWLHSMSQAWDACFLEEVSSFFVLLISLKPGDFEVSDSCEPR